MAFSQEIKIKAMIACGRCCSICHKFCGNNMEVHHIKHQSESGSDEFDNAIPLCFDCHAEVGQYDSSHPKGIRFTEKELQAHRDNWYKKVVDNQALTASPEYKDIDIITYNKLKGFLPKGLIQFVRDIEFSGWSYKLGQFQPLELFYESAEDPLLEYIDADLESQRMKLSDSIKQFFNDSFSCIFCDNGVNCLIPRDWIEKNPDLFNSYVDKLNKDTLDIYNSYCDYIKLCRRKLEITGE